MNQNFLNHRLQKLQEQLATTTEPQKSMLQARINMIKKRMENPSNPAPVPTNRPDPVFQFAPGATPQQRLETLKTRLTEATDDTVKNRIQSRISFLERIIEHRNQPVASVRNPAAGLGNAKHLEHRITFLETRIAETNDAALKSQLETRLNQMRTRLTALQAK